MLAGSDATDANVEYTTKGGSSNDPLRSVSQDFHGSISKSVLTFHDGTLKSNYLEISCGNTGIAVE